MRALRRGTSHSSGQGDGCGWEGVADALGDLLLSFFLCCKSPDLMMPSPPPQWDQEVNVLKSNSVTGNLHSYAHFQWLVYVKACDTPPGKEDVKVMLQMGLGTAFSPDRRSHARRNLFSGFEHNVTSELCHSCYDHERTASEWAVICWGLKSRNKESCWVLADITVLLNYKLGIFCLYLSLLVAVIMR